MKQKAKQALCRYKLHTQAKHDGIEFQNRISHTCIHSMINGANVTVREILRRVIIELTEYMFIKLSNSLQFWDIKCNDCMAARPPANLPNAKSHSYHACFGADHIIRGRTQYCLHASARE